MMILRRLACLALVASAARGLACPQLPVAHDAPNPFELQLGATNVNAALGSGKLTAAFSRCGELTVLKWPGPSYYGQLDYLASNAPDARTRPPFGALDSQGAFPGIAQDQVRFFVRELTTPGTMHMGEQYGRYQLDVNGDGIAPDYVAENDVPHVWEHAYLFIAAMTAFGSR
jgi:hypothetical protein